MRKEKRLVIANWKMNPATLAEAKTLFRGTMASARKARRTTVVVCPPFVFLHELSRASKKGGARLGAQNIAFSDTGAFTGEVSAAQIMDGGGEYVIIGHSERRRMGETNGDVERKVERALTHGLTPIICVGENERDPHGNYLSFIAHQATAALEKVKLSHVKNIIIAYEPIWAIGKTGADAITPRKLHETTLFIRKILSEKYIKSVALGTTILYGGSAEPNNVSALLREGDIQGFLVGHASLDAKGFASIIHTTDSYIP